MITKSHKTIFIIFCTLLIGGCAQFEPVKTELPLLTETQSTDENEADSNLTKLTILNTSNFVLYGLDNSGRINIKFDGKGIAQLNICEYVRLMVPKGKHQIDLVHKDVLLFSSQHQIELPDAISFLSVYTAPTSNRVKLLKNLPKDFNTKFRPVDMAYPKFKKKTSRRYEINQNLERPQ